MHGFESVSIILPVINETDSLIKSVEIIQNDCDSEVKEIITVVCRKTIPKSLEICERLRDKIGERFIVLNQKRPFLGGAIQDAFEIVKGSHVILMASDLETPPDKVKELISEARKYPDAVITGSRWMKGGNFEGYDPLKYVLNFIFQKIFSFLYRARLTDMTYAYRIFPTELVSSIRWEELRHAFLFETLVKPLRLGTTIVEIPVIWQSRVEGVSQNTFLQNFIYFRIGIKTLFYTKEQILKSHNDKAKG